MVRVLIEVYCNNVRIDKQILVMSLAHYNKYYQSNMNISNNIDIKTMILANI